MEPRRLERHAHLARPGRARHGLGGGLRRVGHYVTTIDAYERPSVLGFDAKNPRTEAHVRFDFAPDGGDATSVSCVVELTMKGGMRLLEPLLAPLIRKQIERERPPSLSHAFAHK